MTDFPKVRAHHVCPVCNGPKDLGLIACWPCFRNRGVKTGQMEKVLEAREAELSGVRSVRVADRPVKVVIAPDNPDASIDATVFLVSVWLGEMLDSHEIDGPAFHDMMRELASWANEARASVVAVAN